MRKKSGEAISKRFYTKSGERVNSDSAHKFTACILHSTERLTSESQPRRVVSSAAATLDGGELGTELFRLSSGYFLVKRY